MQPRCSQLEYGEIKWQHHWPGQPELSSLLLLTHLPGCMPMPPLLLLLSKSTDVSFHDWASGAYLRQALFIVPRECGGQEVLGSIVHCTQSHAWSQALKAAVTASGRTAQNCHTCELDCRLRYGLQHCYAVPLPEACRHTKLTSSTCACVHRWGQSLFSQRIKEHLQPCWG